MKRYKHSLVVSYSNVEIYVEPYSERPGLGLATDHPKTLLLLIQLLFNQILRVLVLNSEDVLQLTMQNINYTFFYKHDSVKQSQFRVDSLGLLQVRSLGRFPDVGLDVEVYEQAHDDRHVGHPDDVVCLRHCTLVIVQINHVADGYYKLCLQHKE